MKPIKFSEANMKFTAPPGREQEVDDLPVFSDGNQIISCWELTDEELIEVIKTKKVYLGVMGNTTPPIMLMGKSPFVINNGEYKARDSRSITFIVEDDE